MRFILYLVLILVIFAGFSKKTPSNIDYTVVSNGQMPSITRDKAGIMHLVYGRGDSILYRYSNNGGKSFSIETIVSVLPGLAASHTRGPQVSPTDNGLLIIACSNSGNIYSFSKKGSNTWYKGNRVNDEDSVAKENLMGISSDGKNAFAVWLDLREGHNKIFGSRSQDGGMTWGKNVLIYASPDKTVCECCKPSVAMKGNHIYVMFRNWFNGNRDLYLAASANSGQTFTKAEKLGTGSWPLKGCPMDGGGLVLNKNGQLETVWNRNGTIYSCRPGKQEVELGKGRSCSMESVNGKDVYAWVENGEVIVLKPEGKKLHLGKGQLPILKAINPEHILCVWERDKQIFTSRIEL